jgi:hypothetical protein
VSPRRAVGDVLREVDRRWSEAPFEVPIALLLAVVGWVGVASGQGITPPSLEAALSIWLVQTWTLLLGLGGTLTACGKATGRERVEASGLVMLGWGLTLYGGTLLLTGGVGGVTAAGLCLAFAAGVGRRLVTIRHDMKVRRQALEMVRLHTARGGCDAGH